MPINLTKIKAAKQSVLGKKLLAAALSYAQQGLRVFPITPNEAFPPLITEWQHKATCDLKQIKKWWATWPEANVAIATGMESGVIVVDVDMKNGKNGKATLSALVKQHENFATRMAGSPTGGEHYHFKSPGYKIGNRAGFAHGIDFRGDGGYIVVAPSRRSEGVYAWTNDSDIAPCPAWLLDLIKTEKSAEVKATASDADKIVAGSRNAYLASLAGSMRNKGAVPEAIHAALIAQNQSKCAPPLSDEEVATIANSISKYEPSASVVHTEITAEELFTKDIPEPTWMVPSLIPTGVTLLAGRPKIGKSYLTLGIAIGVASGTAVLGTAVEQQGVSRPT
jgi:putative DNA primase/helicase